MTISKTYARDLIFAQKGKFLTIEFTDKKGNLRIMNGQCLVNQKSTNLGYVSIKEAVKIRSKAKSCIRKANLQTMTKLKCGGASYTIK